MKVFEWAKDKNTEKFTSHSRNPQALNVRNDQPTYGQGVAPAQLMHPNMPHNKFSTKIFAMTANQYNTFMAWRPTITFQRFLRTNNSTTGVINPSTTALSLVNGTGTVNNGDVFVITWKQEGDLNDNIEEAILWLKRTGAAAGSTIRLALFDITALSTTAPPALDGLGAGVGVTPLTLDLLHYYANSALAYAEVAFNSVTTNVNGEPVRFQFPYHSREDRTTGLVANNVYALVLYLNRNAAEVGTINVFGSNVAADDAYSVTYLGAAGWNGVMGTDATCLAAYYQLQKTGACVVNQINLFADPTQNLGGTVIEKMVVQPADDDAIKNLQVGENHLYNLIEVVSGLRLGDQVQHSILPEGKVIIERFHFLKILARVGYTGNLTVQCNYWCETRGNQPDEIGVTT
jgi:hypothetical protein